MRKVPAPYNFFGAVCLLMVILTIQGQEGFVPIEGVVIDRQTANPIGQARVELESEARQVQAVTADDQGRFIVRAAPGRYIVRAIKQGLFMASPFAVNNSSAAVKGVRLEMLKGASITGRVLDQNRRPLSNATVVMLRSYYDNSHHVLRPPGSKPNWYPGDPNIPNGTQVITDDQGRYRAFGLEPGSFYMGVWTEKETGVRYYPGTADPSLPIILSEGTAFAATDIILSEEKTYSISFQPNIISPCPIPAEATHLWVVRIASNGFEIPELQQLNLGSDLVSKYSLQVRSLAGQRNLADHPAITLRLLPGTYEIYFSSCWSPLSVENMGHVQAQVKDRDVDLGAVPINPAVVVRGRIRPSPELLTQSVVALFRLDNQPNLSFLYGTPTGPVNVGPDGFFELRAVPGKYAVGVLPLRDTYVASVKAGPLDLLSAGLTIDGELPGPLEVVLGELGGTIRGKIVDSTDKPVSGAQVVLLPPVLQRSNTTLFKTTVSDQVGEFAFHGIPPGDFEMIAWQNIAPDQFMDESFLNSFSTRTTKVHIEKGATKDQVLRVVSTP